VGRAHVWLGIESRQTAVAGEQQALYANRRCIQGQRGLRLLRLRGEKLERWNQHLYDRGGMRRVHLRGRENILKRLVRTRERRIWDCYLPLGR
jgi:hypothetical protein